jgi:hypothetical protein
VAAAAHPFLQMVTVLLFLLVAHNRVSGESTATLAQSMTVSIATEKLLLILFLLCSHRYRIPIQDIVSCS